jgi:hypothetical protein
MLLAGSDDGVYRIDGLPAGAAEPTQVLESDRAFRVETFPSLPGVFAATASACYHSSTGEDWARLPVPTDATVNAVGAAPDGERLFVGTFPERIYVLEDAGAHVERAADGEPPAAEDWSESTGFREHAEAGDWGLPRHDFQAHVRSIETHPDAPGSVFVGVEVGGVHVSEDRGESWIARNEDAAASEEAAGNDDVHELVVVDPETFVAATGFGCFYTTDAGRSWTDLAGDVGPQYYRSAVEFEGDVYAGGANGPSPTWEEDDDPGLFVSRDGEGFEALESPRPEEVVIGWTAVDGDLIGITYAGTLLRWGEDADGFEVVGDVPTPGELRGRYLPLAWVEQ